MSTPGSPSRGTGSSGTSGGTSGGSSGTSGGTSGGSSGGQMGGAVLGGPCELGNTTFCTSAHANAQCVNVGQAVGFCGIPGCTLNEMGCGGATLFLSTPAGWKRVAANGDYC